MKKLLSILLTLLYVSLLFAPLIPYAEYAVHKEHIMLHYCENPDTDCEGTCYLKKQVEHHQTDQALIVQHIFQVLFFGEKDVTIQMPKGHSMATVLYSEDLTDSPPFTLLQPPQA